jgi:hypothetical protein
MPAEIGEMQVSESVFIEGDFIALIVFSILLPVGIYIYMMWKKAISRTVVLLLSIILIAISGIDVFLLQRLTAMAKTSASLFDDIFFASEMSVALYLLPLLFAGIGMNLISHILISHLGDAEMRFD